MKQYIAILILNLFSVLRRKGGFQRNQHVKCKPLIMRLSIPHARVPLVEIISSTNTSLWSFPVGDRSKWLIETIEANHTRCRLLAKSAKLCPYPILQQIFVFIWLWHYTNRTQQPRFRCKIRTLNSSID